MHISLHLISAIKMKIANVEKEIDTEQKNLDYWKDYKDKGQHDHKKEVYLLSKELEDMENSFKEMIGKGNNFVKGEVTLGEETETILNEMIGRGSNFVIGEVTLGEKTENIFNEMIGRGNNFVIGEITLGEDMMSNL